MDEQRHPKRRKDKYNPYTLSVENGRYYLSFSDGEGVYHNMEIDSALYELIFVDDKDISRPLQYITIKSKVLTLINQEDLKDDNGKRFTFNTHMFRRSYGVKLTELHLDDWTIAKLLGHSNINSVRHYRKMSNQILADETRKAREMQTRILLENLSDWEEDYEQLRQYARI